MKHRIMKLSAAAIIFIAATLTLTVFDKTVSPTYALQQTIDAYKSLRFMHFTEYSTETNKPLQIVWAEFNPDGKIKNFRCYQLTGNDGSGFQDTIIADVNDGSASMWRCSDKSTVLYCGRLRIEKNGLTIDEYLSRTLKLLDPKQFFEEAKKLHNKKKATIIVKQPADISKPIHLTVTFESKLEFLFFSIEQIIAEIDQTSKFALKLNLVKPKDGKYQEKSVIKYQNFNQPIDPAIFEFDKTNGQASVSAKELLKEVQ